MILNNYPKTAELLQDYYTTMMLASIDRANIPDDFKETIKKDGVSLDKIDIIVNSNPRHLFEFFDDRSMYINITSTSEGSFTFSIMGDNATTGSSTVYSDRKRADRAAVEEAMRQLENIITNSVIDKENS
jgi:hypothetical protein